MKDLTVSEFCRRFGACKDGREWAYRQLPERSKAKMSAIWPLLIARPQDLCWVTTRGGVFSNCDLRLMACRFVRETPLADGRKVWDLLADDRSKNAVIIAEKSAIGEATEEERAAASAAACAAAWAAASAAARDAASAAWAAARDAAWGAERDAAWAASAAARDAAWAARDAASPAASAAAWAAAWEYQSHIIISYGNPFKDRF
jgi:hypothetical protein